MAELSVSRKNIVKLLSEMQDKKFVIPEYQRPYDWDLERCETLWSDITLFSVERSEGQEYFLGTVVTSKNTENEKEVEVIDGQQRITSLFLLLRAFYTKLEGMIKDENILGLMSQISPCIWDVDRISMKVKNRECVHIESRVSTAEDNEVLHKILSEGGRDFDSDSKYAQNYNFFFEKCEEYAMENPLSWQRLCVTILHYCIVLPIECENQDAALTIFNTLNDRGMPLSDSDIFKAQMFKNTPIPDRPKFANRWKTLRESGQKANVELDDLFRFYAHYIRGLNRDKTKEIALRKFYAESQYSKLKSDNFLDDLESLCEFWDVLNNYRVDSDINLDFESMKLIHCLHNYPNEFWKYLVSSYYLKNRYSADFPATFSAFLKRTIAFLFAKFIERPSVNAIKDDVYQAVIDIVSNGDAVFKSKVDGRLEEMLGASHKSKIARGLILLHAYLNERQTTLIPSDFEVEHIFPKSWQNSNYNGWTSEDAELFLERFGNKCVIESKVNIQAGNGYFNNKKKKYMKSEISDVHDLRNLEQPDWNKLDIEERDRRFQERILSFINEYS